MIDSILCKVGSWLLVTEEFKECYLNVFMRDWVSCVSSSPHEFDHVIDWVPLRAGKVKINFDGASSGNPEPAGFGCVMRDSRGSVFVVKCGSWGEVILIMRS